MKVRSLKIAAVSLLFVSTAWLPVQAQQFKAGFVNIDRILRDSKSAKVAQTRLENEFSKREKDIISLGNSVQAAAARFEKEAPTLPDAERTKRQRALLDQDVEFQRKRTEFQEDLSARKTEELSRVLENANAVVMKIAESEKFDVILQEAVYINPSLDITEKVLKAVDAASK